MGLSQADPQFINSLVEDGKISHKAFSFYINNSTTSSFVDIGAPQSGNVNGGSEAIRYIPVDPDDYFWSAYNKGVSFGNSPNSTNSFKYGSLANFTEDAEADESAYTIFDTSLPYIMIANQHFDSFLGKLFEEVGGYDYNITDGIGI